jgi:nucleoid-associated protein YgaU
MGLFSFLKNAGANLFHEMEKNTPANKEQNQTAEPNHTLKKNKEQLLKGAVLGLGIPVKHLEIDLDGEVVYVFGEVNSHDDREKIILALGNVEGIRSVDDRLSVKSPEPKPAPVPKTRFHEVKRGESLSKIAKRYYGDPMKYTIIFEANQPLLKDPNLIYPGQTLRIPHI